MIILNIFNELNGSHTLTKLKPSYIQFAKTDTSDIVRGSKEEADATWGDTKIKAIGAFSSNAANNFESIFFKNFMRNPLE